MSTFLSTNTLGQRRTLLNPKYIVGLEDFGDMTKVITVNSITFVEENISSLMNRINEF